MSPSETKNSKSEPRIAIIGSGTAGLTCAIALKQKYGYTNFTVYEKAGDVGGTWRDNIYPGCSSDITMPFYCLSTELRNWTHSHLPQPEILAYWVELAHKHSLYPHITFNRLVDTVDWDPTSLHYNIVVQNTLTGEREASQADIVISAVGILETPRYAAIEGVDTFGGDLFHSGRWDYSKELRGKRVGVVGNGASAAQFVPIISQDPSVGIVQFCRTRNWMLPDLKKAYTARRALFNVFPFLMKVTRIVQFAKFDSLYVGVFSNSVTRWVVEKVSEYYMKKTAPAKYRDSIVPDYAIGCKRIVFDAGYLKALHRPNLQLNYDGIEKIVEDGIVTKTGEHIPLDVIIFATGYAADSYKVPIKGSKGQTIQQYYEEQGGPKAYFGTAVPGFPNFFLIFGPNIVTGHTSVVWTNEMQVNYIMQLIQPILEREVASIEVKEDATNAYDAKIQGRLQQSVFTQCHSWYRVGGTGKITNAFPAAAFVFYMWFRKPNWDHYTYTGMGADLWLKKQRLMGQVLSAGRLTLCGVTATMIGLYFGCTLPAWSDVNELHALVTNALQW